MQLELDRIYELLDSVEGASPEKANELKDAVSNYNTFEKTGAEPSNSYTFAPNPAELRSAALSVTDGVLTVRFETAYGVQILQAGDGEWLESHPMLRYCNPSIHSLDPHFGHIETLNLRSRFEAENGTVHVICKHIDTPHTQTFTFSDDALRMSCYLGDLHPEVRQIACC